MLGFRLLQLGVAIAVAESCSPGLARPPQIHSTLASAACGVAEKGDWQLAQMLLDQRV